MEDEEIKNISSSISSMSIEANTSLENEDSFKKDGHAIENTSKENVQDTLGSGENPDGFDIIKNILGNCKPNLSVYFPRFEDAKIVNCSISCLSQQSIDSLFPELGYRDIFKKALEDFRSDYQSEEKRTPAKNGVDNYRKFTSWKKKVSSFEIIIFEKNEKIRNFPEDFCNSKSIWWRTYSQTLPGISNFGRQTSRRNGSHYYKIFY